MEPPSQTAPVRSVSRRRVPLNVARRRSAPGRPMKDQSPLTTFMLSNWHRSNMLPTSLHSVKIVSKKLHERKVQFTKAAPSWMEALKRTRRKVQALKTLPTLRPSVRSSSEKSVLS